MENKVRILIVEDEPLLRLGIVDHLEEEGFVTFEAGNAADALALLEKREGAVDVVFTDVDMPGTMDGIELAAVIRQRWPALSIAVTSGFRLVELAELPTGSLFFPKPYDPEAIARALRALAEPS